MTDGLFSLYANSVEAVSPTEDELASFGLDQPYSIVTVWFDGTESFTLKASAPDRNNYVYLMKEGSPLVYLVSASRLSWLKVQTEQLTQSVYTPVEVTELSGFSVTSEDASYDLWLSILRMKQRQAAMDSRSTQNCLRICIRQ